MAECALATQSGRHFCSTFIPQGLAAQDIIARITLASQQWSDARARPTRSAPPLLGPGEVADEIRQRPPPPERAGPHNAPAANAFVIPDPSVGENSIQRSTASAASSDALPAAPALARRPPRTPALPDVSTPPIHLRCRPPLSTNARGQQKYLPRIPTAAGRFTHGYWWKSKSDNYQIGVTVNGERVVRGTADTEREAADMAWDLFTELAGKANIYVPPKTPLVEYAAVAGQGRCSLPTPPPMPASPTKSQSQSTQQRSASNSFQQRSQGSVRQSFGFPPECHRDFGW
ncbi:hypothetical protein WJX73_000005 [Symbiochloris irregularis]|uniref:AP2/ERF domain-containing protein n=1 Tax=Symbiochloris irregularis TaxID=706552 RepID=A0AAW1PIV4_9CHLO